MDHLCFVEPVDRLGESVVVAVADAASAAASRSFMAGHLWSIAGRREKEPQRRHRAVHRRRLYALLVLTNLEHTQIPPVVSGERPRKIVSFLRGGCSNCFASSRRSRGRS